MIDFKSHENLVNLNGTHSLSKVFMVFYGCLIDVSSVYWLFILVIRGLV